MKIWRKAGIARSGKSRIQYFVKQKVNLILMDTYVQLTLIVTHLSGIYPNYPIVWKSPQSGREVMCKCSWGGWKCYRWIKNSLPLPLLSVNPECHVKENPDTKKTPKGFIKYPPSNETHRYSLKKRATKKDLYV